MLVSIVSLENNSHTEEDTRSLWQSQKAAVSCPSPPCLVLTLTLTTQRQWRLGVRYQEAWEDESFLALRIFTAAMVPRCPARTGASKAADQHVFLFLNSLSCPSSQWGKGKHATDRTCLVFGFFYQTINIFFQSFSY